jgi:ABC-type multidrug transport system fused ATPase/permease subunit
MSSQRLRIIDLVRPHWKALTIALVAVLGETLTDILEPWPIKIVVDNILQSKKLPSVLGGIVTGLFGSNASAVLYFAVAAVALIAIVGAVSSYVEKYLTTSVSQWVGHDLRRTLYHHIQRLSLAEHDQVADRRPDHAGHQRHRRGPGLHQLGAPRHARQRDDAGRHDRSHALPQLALHPHRAVGRASALPGGVLLHAPHQERLSRGSHSRRANCSPSSKKC